MNQPAPYGPTLLVCNSCGAQNSDPGGPVEGYVCGVCGRPSLIRVAPVLQPNTRREQAAKVVAGGALGGALGAALFGPFGAIVGGMVGLVLGGASARGNARP